MCYARDVNGSCPQCPECFGRRETILALDNMFVKSNVSAFSVFCLRVRRQSQSMFAVEKHKTAFQQMDVTGVDSR